MNINAFLLAEGEHGAIAGQTGSGKTFLARQLLEQRPDVYCVVLDPKGLITWPGWLRFTSLKKLTESESPRLVYQPAYGELRNAEIIDHFFGWIYERRHTTVYVDEIYAIARGDVYPWNYGACLTRGRERGISVLTATQRPAYVPGIMFSESSKVFTFYLKLEQDRKRVGFITGVDPDAIQSLRKHQFYFAPQDDVVSGPYMLRMSSRTSTGPSHGTESAPSIRSGNPTAA